MAKAIKISDETYEKLYKRVSQKRNRLLKEGTPENVSFDDIIKKLLEEEK